MMVERIISGDDKVPFMPTNIYFNSPIVDSKAMDIELQRRRYQRNMARQLDQKIQIDKQSFQQLTNIQNAQIQKLGEIVKMNQYYINQKSGNGNIKLDKDIQEQKDEDYKIQS